LDGNERVEDPIVADTYAVVDPRAVVVEVIDAFITLEAMTASWGTKQLTFKAKSCSVKLFK
jgi:hypothetical protein